MDQELILKDEPKNLNVMRPTVTLQEVQKSRQEMHTLIQKGLKRDTDYGRVPNTKRDTLYLPGAQQVCGWFDCYPTYQILSEDHDPEYTQEITTKKGASYTAKGLHTFRMKCVLIHRPTGRTVGEGVGSCSTLENKYKSRPHELENTILKMAKKRSFVDAALTTFSLSDRFTQDLEDLGPTPPEKQTRVKKEERIELPDGSPIRYSDYKGKTYVWAYVGETFDAGDLRAMKMKESEKKPGSFSAIYTEDIVTALLELHKDRQDLPAMEEKDVSKK